MMKKVFYVIITASILLCACHLDHRMPEYDNLVKKEDAITRQYPREMVDELTHKIEEEEKKVGYGKLRRMFRLECVRKTEQGYYAVLQLTDGSNTFIFMDDRLTVSKVAVYDCFRTKEEFEKFLSEKQDATRADVLSFDPNEYPMPFSVVSEEAHIVQEGVIIVRYRREDGHPVDQIFFYSNSEIAVGKPREITYFIKYGVPYVLEIDRVN